MIDQNQLINFIKNNNHASFFQIVKKFNVKPNQNKKFTLFLNELKKQGIIRFSKKINGFYIPVLIASGITTIRIINKDYGFINYQFNDEEIRAIVFKENFNTAIDGDEVKFKIFKDFEKPNLFFGIIEKIISRKHKYIYGYIDDKYDFIPVSFSKTLDFIFPKDNLKKNVFVKYEIEKIENDKMFLQLIESYQNINEPFADINFIVKTMNIEECFNSEVIKESNLIPDEINGKTSDGRVDLTNLFVVTIDGEKTKDFDDAISVIKTEKNTYILGVHIADVAHYVKNNSAIDKQALERGTSIYLLNKVIPMLPEKLSNGICSLNPNVDRYTLTLESEIDSYGNVIWTKLYPSTINSKYRLTYNQVHNYKKDDEINKNIELKIMIENAYELSNILLKVKKEEGYIDFEIKDPIIELDEENKVKNIKILERLSSEILIENFMVFANERVSEIVNQKGLTSIYRVHEAPTEEKFNNLSSVLKTIGINNLKVSISDDPKTFANLVNEIKKERFDDFIKINLLRTMQKAKYSPINIGHFGLASKFYSHFTSPIRRYPDLVLHRIIWELIFKKNKDFEKEIKNKINYIANQSSIKEEEAVIVERKVNDIKKSEFYISKIGNVLKGTIVSIKKFGLFVEFADKVDALVSTSNISNNICVVNEKETEIICGIKKYKLGDVIEVEIIGISKMEGKIDAKIV